MGLAERSQSYMKMGDQVKEAEKSRQQRTFAPNYDHHWAKYPGSSPIANRSVPGLKLFWIKVKEWTVSTV
jgi:hypothetical protein